MFEDGVVHHFDAQLDGVGGRARAHWDPAIGRYVVPLAVAAFVLQWTVEVGCFSRVAARAQVQGYLDFAVDFACAGFGECEGGVDVRTFGHVRGDCADGDGRGVVQSAVFIGDAAGRSVGADISAFRCTDRCTKVFTDFIIIIIHRYDSNRRHIRRSSTQWDRDSDSCQGFSQSNSMRHTRRVSISDALNIIRFKLTQIKFEHNGAVL